MITAGLAFAGVAMLINMAPGPDSLLVVRTSVTQGRRGGLAAALGVLTGCVGWGIATAAGLTALLTASHVAYDTLRVCGAAYLVLLGATALRRSGKPADPEPARRSTVPASRSAAFRLGVGTNLLNPKAGVFYMSLIPQFVPPDAEMFSATLLFTAIDVIELAAWYWLLSRAASALSERVQRPAFRAASTGSPAWPSSASPPASSPNARSSPRCWADGTGRPRRASPSPGHDKPGGTASAP